MTHESKTVRSSLSRLRHGKTDPFPFIATLVVASTCIALGFWQLDRADQKRDIKERRDIQINAAPISIVDGREFDGKAPGAIEFAKVNVAGEWLGQHEILIDNRVESGVNGCHVMTPLLIHGSRTVVLVNRGWVPWGNDRSVLPETTLTGSKAVIAGRISIPATNVFSLSKSSESDSSAQTTRLWQVLDLDRYATTVDFALLPFVVRMDPPSDADDAVTIGTATIDKVNGEFVGALNPDGYLRNWREPDDLWVQRHLGYAVQWFGLAFMAIVFFLFRVRRGRQHAPSAN